MLTVDKMRESTQIPLKHDPVKSVELLADKFQLTENERDDILRQFFMGGDNSRYGLVNAVTAAGKIAKTLKIKAKDTDMHLTLNPIRTRTLAKYLIAALAQIDFTELADAEHFGDLTVEIEHDNSHNSQYDDAEYALSVPFQSWR